MGETFDDSINNDNPIPREYHMIPVDDRVNIYSYYTDDLYNKFIEEGKKIHKKFNEKNYCNSKNDKLLFHSESCTFKDPHEHGGYKCNKETNKWDIVNCQPYFCDIGYYFDQNKKKCVEECSFNDTKSYFIYDDFYNKTYEIKKDIFYSFDFVYEKLNSYYFYNSSEDLVSYLPKLGFINYDGFYINEKKDAKNNFILNISKIESDFQFNLFKVGNFYLDKIEFFNKKIIYIIQTSKDLIFYSYDIFNQNDNKITFAQYNNEMKPEDIVLGNDKYFTNYTDNFITLEKNKINILCINYSSLSQIHYYFNEKNNNKYIYIKDKNINTIYLQRDKKYILDFKNNIINRMIKLSKKTINSEINITSENVIINSNNLYYQIKDDFKGKITLVANNDAIIEFLFKMPDVKVFDFEQLKNTFSSKKYSLIKLSQKFLNKNVNLTFKTNKDKIYFNIFFGFSKPPYSYYYFTQDNVNTLGANNNTFYYNFIIPIENNLIEDEYFCILIENLVEGNLEIEGDIQNDDDKNKNEKGFQTWKIILIIVAAVVLLIIIIIIVYCIKKKNNQLNSSQYTSLIHLKN